MPDSTRRSLDRLIGRSLLTAESLLGTLRKRLINAVTRNDDLGPILRDITAVMTQLQVDAEMTAWIAGAGEVVKKTPAAILDVFLASGPPGAVVTSPVPEALSNAIIRFPLIQKAAQDLMERNIVTRAVFDTLERDARRRAFTVATLDTQDALETVRDVLAENVREGASLGGFRKQLEERIGSSRLGSAHVELVFRNNVQSAFTEGHDRLAKNPVVEDVLPYRRYVAIRDDRARPEHLALETFGIDGTDVYRAADEFWTVFRIPWAHNCRCGSILMTIEAAARAGVREATEWIRTGVKPPLISRLPAIPFRPQPEFA